ncbi:hypothetical protein [Streptomyces sp. NPDC047990]|uniref:hypothetical protein n=1 Tax=Streptomyces sp. NPDC047990 TaxID=3365496 RepID=UPI0037164334
MEPSGPSPWEALKGDRRRFPYLNERARRVSPCVVREEFLMAKALGIDPGTKNSVIAA